MLINFDNIKETEVKNFHNGDKVIYFKTYEDNDFKIMKSIMVPGSSNGLHEHIDNAEIIYVISGKGYAIVDGEKEILVPGVVTYCKKGSSHAIFNDGCEDLVCFNVVNK